VTSRKPCGLRLFWRGRGQDAPVDSPEVFGRHVDARRCWVVLAYSLRRHLPEAALGHRVCPQGPRRVLRGDRVAHRIGRLLVL
jgi:hypothetical protein